MNLKLLWSILIFRGEFEVAAVNLNLPSEFEVAVVNLNLLWSILFAVTNFELATFNLNLPQRILNLSW